MPELSHASVMPDDEYNDLEQLAMAVRLLEQPGLGARIADWAGKPIDVLITRLPRRFHHLIDAAAQHAIDIALEAALWTLPFAVQTETKTAANWQHTAAAAVAGLGGGFFGVQGLLIELPISTGIMMRSIADIARSEGADMNDADTRLECVQILGMGHAKFSETGIEAGYFAARETLRRSVQDASIHLAKHGLQKKGAPALISLASRISEQFSVNLTEKTAAQCLPVLGSIGGAALNTLFIRHFQTVARAHFVIRRLERVRGEAWVSHYYRRFSQKRNAA